MKEIENNMYYQTNIKTSRNEDSVYAMKYVSQQILIDKLQQENQQLKEKYNKALEILNEYNLPCEIDKFNTKEENLDYCSKNCSVDEEIFIKCWDRFIEQEIEKG